MYVRVFVVILRVPRAAITRAIKVMIAVRVLHDVFCHFSLLWELWDIFIYYSTEFCFGFLRKGEHLFSKQFPFIGSRSSIREDCGLAKLIVSESCAGV